MMGLATAVSIPAVAGVMTPARPNVSSEKLATDESYWAQIAAQKPDEMDRALGPDEDPDPAN